MSLLLHLIRSIDIAFYNWIGQFAGNWVLDRLVSQEEANNILKGGIFLAVYWYLWFRAGPDRNRRRSAIVVILIGSLLALILGRTISFLLPFRIRPMYDPNLVHPSYSIQFLPNLENWSAFPSDAAIYFFALAFGIGYLARRLAIPIFLFTAGWICLPRLYIGVHHLSDVVGGAVIGVAIVWTLLKTEWMRSLFGDPVVRFEQARPDWFYAIAFLVSFELADLFADVRNVGHAALHIARVPSLSKFLRLAFGVVGVAILVVYGLITWHRRNHIPSRRISSGSST